MSTFCHLLAKSVYFSNSMEIPKFKSHRVQAEYERFLAGEINRYAALFIAGVIPNRRDFHQQFDLYVKLTPYADRGEFSVESGEWDREKLDQYNFNDNYSFPHQRIQSRGCNDICWCCGNWCVELTGNAKFGTYVCLIGKFRNANRHHHIREKSFLSDPIDQRYPTPPYPFLCWNCYNSHYKTLISIRFFGHVYVIDHAFIMNEDYYDFCTKPLFEKRTLSRNLKWRKLNTIPLKILALLNLEGQFVFFQLSSGGDYNVMCALCGDRVGFNTRASYMAGRPAQIFPMLLYTNGKRDYDDSLGWFIDVCDDCMRDSDGRTYFPFGIEFKPDEIFRIND
jgi:hypothetical protein